MLSDGTLVDGFMLFDGSGANKKGQEIVVLISPDRGETWTEPITVAKALPGFVSDPAGRGRSVQQGRTPGSGAASGG